MGTNKHGAVATLGISTAGSGGPYTAIAGITDINFNVTRDSIETTDHDGNGWKSFIAGDAQVSLDVTAFYEEDDSGQGAVMDNIEANGGAEVHFRFRPWGTDAVTPAEEWIFAGFVIGSPITTPQGGAETFNFSVQPTGAPTRQNQT